MMLNQGMKKIIMEDDAESWEENYHGGWCWLWWQWDEENYHGGGCWIMGWWASSWRMRLSNMKWRKSHGGWVWTLERKMDTEAEPWNDLRFTIWRFENEAGSWDDKRIYAWKMTWIWGGCKNPCIEGVQLLERGIAQYSCYSIWLQLSIAINLFCLIGLILSRYSTVCGGSGFGDFCDNLLRVRLQFVSGMGLEE